MKPKIKDGTKMNLYVDRSIVKILDACAAENNTSRSQYVERLVRETNTASLREASAAEKDFNSSKSEKFDKAKLEIASRIHRKPRKARNAK